MFRATGVATTIEGEGEGASLVVDVSAFRLLDIEEFSAPEPSPAPTS